MKKRSTSLLHAPRGGSTDLLASSREGVQELADQISAAAQVAGHQLLRKQDPRGFWQGDLTADTTLESDYVLLLLWLFPPGAKGWDQSIRAKIEKATRTILHRQLPDGGWSIYSRGPAEVNATARSYVALRICGFDPADGVMQRARDRILSLGGLQAINSYTKNNLSLFGLFPRKYIPTVPIELFLLPGKLLYEMSSWSRVILVPLSTVQATGVRRRVPGNWTLEELFLPKAQFPLPPKGPLFHLFNFVDRLLKLSVVLGWKRVRAKAIRKAEKWMLDHMRFTDGLGAIFPAMMYSLMAMDALGYERTHPDVVDMLQQVEGLILKRGDTTQLQPSLSPTWDTAISVFALGELGIEGRGKIQQAADWLLSHEVRRNGDWSVKCPNLQPGGWPFQFRNEHYPDIDTTAMVLLALQRAKASDPKRQTKVEGRAMNWILGMQSSDGGWAAYDIDNNWEWLNKLPFADHNAMVDSTCPDITGRVLEALCSRGLNYKHTAVARGVQYLLDHQQPDGSWYGRWGVNYTYGTFLAVRGLRATLSPMVSTAIQYAAKWVHSVQNPDGGWGESCASYEQSRFVSAPSTASQTAWALLVLEAADDGFSDSVQRGITWLFNHQNQNGEWDEEFMTGTGFPKVFYLKYYLYPHYFPLLALSAWQKHLQIPCDNLSRRLKSQQKQNGVLL